MNEWYFHGSQTPLWQIWAFPDQGTCTGKNSKCSFWTSGVHSVLSPIFLLLHCVSSSKVSWCNKYCCMCACDCVLSITMAWWVYLHFATLANLQRCKPSCIIFATHLLLYECRHFMVHHKRHLLVGDDCPTPMSLIVRLPGLPSGSMYNFFKFIQRECVKTITPDGTWSQIRATPMAPEPE